MRKLSVCLSVCLSIKRVNCDKTTKTCAHILTPYERSFILVFWSGFPLYFGIKIQGLSRTCSCIFKDQFSTEVYSMDSIRATCNIYFCDHGTADKKQNVTIIIKSCFKQNTCLTELPIFHSLTWWIQGLSRTRGIKFKDFQKAPVLFSSTFKALNLGEKKSATFKYFQGCVGTLSDKKNGWWGRPHLCLKFWVKLTLLERKRRLWIDIRL